MTHRMPPPTDTLFAGQGAMAGRLRAADWSATPLGASQTWPQGLRVALRLVLTGQSAMWLAWGSALTFFGNDAVMPVIGANSNWSPGSPASSIWGHAWTTIAPHVESVIVTGDSIVDDNRLLYVTRNGITEETYHSLSYSPLAGNDGKVCGCLCVLTERTERIIAERRLASLAALARHLKPSHTEAEVVAAAIAARAESSPDLPFAVLLLYSETGEPLIAGTGGNLELDEQTVDRVLAFGRKSWQAISTNPTLLDNLLPHVVGKKPAERHDIPQRCLAIRLEGDRHGAAASAPLGVLVCGLSPHLPYDEKYTSYLSLFADQIGAALLRTIPSRSPPVTNIASVPRRDAPPSDDLTRSEEIFREMANHAPVMIWTTTPDGSYSFVNATWQEFTGQSNRQPLGQGWLEALHPEDRAAARDAFLASSSNRQPLQTEFRLRRSNGSYGWVLCSARPRFDDAGHFRGYIGSVIDISERRLAEDALRNNERFLNAVINSSAESIKVISTDGRLELINERGLRLLDIKDASPLIGSDWAMLWPPDYRDRLHAAMRTAIGGGIGRFTGFRPTMRGTPKWWDVLITPVRDFNGQVAKLVCASRDITEEKQHEDQVKLLIGEINHRAKNLLAVVQAVARQTVRDSSSQAYVERLGLRISGLAASHDLLVNNGWRGVDVSDLVQSQLSFVQEIGDRLSIKGPHIVLKPPAAQAIGMALHELATNAIAYGALSNDAGIVVVEWDVPVIDGRQYFRLTWREQGGPPTVSPVMHGFGHVVMVSMAEQALGGSAKLDFARGGLVWTLQAPAHRTITDPAQLFVDHS